MPLAKKKCINKKSFKNNQRNNRIQNHNTSCLQSMTNFDMVNILSYEIIHTQNTEFPKSPTYHFSEF